MISDSGILYIEPRKTGSKDPVIDRATRIMTMALRIADHGRPYRGYHNCICGAHSRSYDYHLHNGEKTNSLAVHYLAYHRDEVSPEQIQKVLALNLAEAEPSTEELTGKVLPAGQVFRGVSANRKI